MSDSWQVWHLISWLLSYFTALVKKWKSRSIPQTAGWGGETRILGCREIWCPGAQAKWDCVQIFASHPVVPQALELYCFMFCTALWFCLLFSVLGAIWLASSFPLCWLSPSPPSSLLVWQVDFRSNSLCIRPKACYVCTPHQGSGCVCECVCINTWPCWRGKKTALKVSEVSTCSWPDLDLAVAQHTSVIRHAAVSSLSPGFSKSLFLSLFLWTLSVSVFLSCFAISFSLLTLSLSDSLPLFYVLSFPIFCFSLPLSVFLSLLPSIMSQTSNVNQHQNQALSEHGAKWLGNPTARKDSVCACASDSVAKWLQNPTECMACVCVCERVCYISQYPHQAQSPSG